MSVSGGEAIRVLVRVRPQLRRELLDDVVVDCEAVCLPPSHRKETLAAACRHTGKPLGKQK
jgi:hypothetical protein